MGKDVSLRTVIKEKGISVLSWMWGVLGWSKGPLLVPGMKFQNVLGSAAFPMLGTQAGGNGGTLELSRLKDG